jgi:hypothetical protein
MLHLGKTIRRRAAIVALASVTTTASVLAAPTLTSASAHPSSGGSPIVAKSDVGMMESRVTGTTEDGRRVMGTFTPSTFWVDDAGTVTPSDDALMVTGMLHAVMRGHGKPQVVDSQQDLPVTGISSPGGGSLATGAAGMPAAAVAGSCDILHLVLGPLDLDLLGLQVHLDQIVLDIVAQSGAGNLLGNLLCAVAGLLDPASPLEGLLTQLTGLLQQILAALQL